MKVIAPPPPNVQAGETPGVDVPRLVPARHFTAFRAAFFREFWPLLPLALCLLLGAGALGGLLAWNGGQKQFWIDLRESNILLIGGLDVLVACGCALAGLAIGICQAQADASSSLWGLVKHRPAGPGLLFGARALAGLALYAIAAGLPVAVLGILAATRGGLFEWHFLLPTVADVLTGLVYYLAGLVVIQRGASFFGSRLVPVVGAGACSAGVCQVPQFGQAVLLIGGAAIVYGLAAMGAMDSNGYRVRTRKLSVAALALVLFAGYSTLLLLGSWGGEEYVVHYAEEAWFNSGPREQWNAPELRALRHVPRSYVNYVLLPDGTWGKRTVPQTPPEAQTQPYDYEANVLYERVGPPATPYIGRLEQRKKLDGTTYDVNLVELPLFQRLAPLEDVGLGYRNLQVTAIEIGSRGGDWYYFEPAGIFRQFDEAGNLTRSLGANGPVAGGGPATGFGIPWARMSRESALPVKGQFSITNSSGIFSVDLARAAVTQQQNFPPGVLGTISMPDGDPLIAVTRDRMYIYRAGDAHPALDVPLRDPRADAGAIYVARLEKLQQWAIRYERTRRVEFYDDQWKRISETAIPGESYELPQIPEAPAWAIAAERDVTRGVAWRTGIIHALCDLPVLRYFDQALGRRPYINYAQSQYSSHGALWYYHWFQIDPEYQNSPWYAGAAGVTLLLSAACMWLLARRYGVRFKGLWVLAAVVFGPVMLLMLPALHVLPGRRACAACGHLRPLRVKACGRCGAAAAPAANGTEIFATTGVKP